MRKSDFLTGNWMNHKVLLWPALEMTKHLKLPVLELGAGDYSTEFLRQYCHDEGLEFSSYDFNKEWADRVGAVHVENWDNIPWRKEWGVVLVDESPGEHRKISLANLHHAQIVVAHDTEIVGAGDYQMRPELEKYKYLYDYETKAAWATAVSNFWDVTTFAKLVE